MTTNSNPGAGQPGTQAQTRQDDPVIETDADILRFRYGILKSSRVPVTLRTPATIDDLGSMKFTPSR